MRGGGGGGGGGRGGWRKWATGGGGGGGCYIVTSGQSILINAAFDRKYGFRCLPRTLGSFLTPSY